MSKKPLFFHDGQNYRIVMNYYYNRLTGYVYVYDPETGSRKVPVYAQDDVRGYESRQTTTRTFTNGGFGTSSWINSALKTGYPPTSPHYGEIINGAPDYWTSNGQAVKGDYIPIKYVPGGSWSTRLGGYWQPSSMFQDVYIVYNNPLNPNTKYQLSFWAKGGAGGSAIVEWHTDIPGPSGIKTRTITISPTGYYNWGLFSDSYKPIDLFTSPPYPTKVEYVKITFIVPAGSTYTDIGAVTFGEYSGGGGP